MTELDTQIAEWRSYVAEGNGMSERDVDELENHLRDQIADLSAAGLAEDEAFLIAVKRMGRIDELTREFAYENSGRLWRQLVTPDNAEGQESDEAWRDMIVFACAAALAMVILRLIIGFPGAAPSWLVRNASLFVAPFLAGYFIRRRGMPMSRGVLAITPFAIAAVVVNLYPYGQNSGTEMLVAAHLPVVLWFAVAYPYMGGVLTSHERRMDFVRFTGEWLIYYVLIALGGSVLLGLTALVLEPTGANVERVIEWVLPIGAAGAVIVAAWLVESKQQVVENMAPVLTMIFTPLFAVMLTVAVVAYLVTGLGAAFDRELLGIFDAMLLVVLGLVLYGISARDPSAPAAWMDRIQLVTVVAALVLDVIVLLAMVARIGDLGFTPNRTAALGLNIALAVNLVGTAWLSTRFSMGKSTFHRLESWQMSYLPVFALWASAVVVVLPPLFSFT
jgi:hypothetical protein